MSWIDNQILPSGRLRSYGRFGVGRPPKADLDNVESNRGGGGYAESYTYNYATSTSRVGMIKKVIGSIEMCLGFLIDRTPSYI
jgi:hypothetical protein